MCIGYTIRDTLMGSQSTCIYVPRACMHGHALEGGAIREVVAKSYRVSHR